MSCRRLFVTFVLSILVVSFVLGISTTHIQAQDAATLPATTKRADPAKTDPYPELALLDKTIVGIGVLRVDRIRSTPFFTLLRMAGPVKKFEQALELIGSGLDDLARVTIVLDQDAVELAAWTMGVRGTASPTAGISSKEMQYNAEQIAMAFESYRESHGRYPRANGDGEGARTGLSWRVHLLPFLGEASLYQQFHLDEPWDSEHNKPLVGKMPGLFRTPGVKDAGQTAFHVFTGEGTLFHGKAGKRIDDIQDGTSNTLLAIAAAPETATEWTKPGGLAYDPKTCRKVLGATDAAFFFAVIVDGRPLPIPSDIRPEALARLVEIGDLEFAEPPAPFRTSIDSRPGPIVMLAFARPYDKSKINRLFEERTLSVFPGPTSLIAEEKLLVIGSPDSLRRLFLNRRSESPTAPSILPLLTADSDAALTLDLGPQTQLIEGAAGKYPAARSFLPATSLSLALNLSQPAGGTLLELTARSSDAVGAQLLLESLASALDQVKQSAGQFSVPIAAPTSTVEEVRKVGVAAIAAAALKQVGSQVVLRVPVPEGFGALPKLFAQPDPAP